MGGKGRLANLWSTQQGYTKLFYYIDFLGTCHIPAIVFTQFSMWVFPGIYTGRPTRWCPWALSRCLVTCIGPCMRTTIWRNRAVAAMNHTVDKKCAYIKMSQKQFFSNSATARWNNQTHDTLVIFSMVFSSYPV